MRKTLILPFICILIFLCVMFIAGTISAVNQWAAGYAPRMADSMRSEGAMAVSFFQYVPAAFSRVLPVSVIVSLFLCFPGVQRSRETRLFSLFLVAATAFIILIFGTMFIQDSPWSQQGEPAPVVFAPEHIHRLDEAVVYADEVQGSLLRGVLVYRSYGEDEGFSFYPEAMIEDEVLVITGTENIPIEPPNPLFGSIFEPPEILEPFFGELSTTSSYYRALYSDSWNSFLFASLGLILLSAGCIFFAAISRWPLINIVLCGVGFRGVFFVHTFLTGDLMTRLIGDISTTGSILTIGSIALGALLILLYSLFSNIHREEELPIG